MLENQKQVSHVMSIKAFVKCAQLQKEYRCLIAERKKHEIRLIELQKKETKHLKYMSKKETRSEPENCKEAKKLHQNDIRSMMVAKKTPSRKDDGCQSDDTIILSDDDGGMSTKSATEDKGNADWQTKASNCVEESIKGKKKEEQIIGQESEKREIKKDCTEKDQSQRDHDKEKSVQSKNNQDYTVNEITKVSQEKNEEIEKLVDQNSVAGHEEISKTSDEEHGKESTAEDGMKTKENFC